MKYTSSIFNSSLGNILEWYDFGLFAIFSSLFGRLFFPAQDPATSVIFTFGIFAIGFLCRPLGALIFGYLGDRVGRAKTLRFSILMISLPTLLIGFIPDYNQAGIIAPILLIIIRMWQGLSIGGEYSGNLIYLAESAPRKWRATFTSFAGVGSNTGILLAAIMGIVTTSFFSTPTLEAWGWRVPYLLSGILSLIIYYFRMQLTETPVFLLLKKHNRLTKNPITTVFKDNLFELLRTFGMVCMGTTFYFFAFAYLPIFLKEKLQLSLANISFIMTIAIALMVIVLPLAGFICDKIGRRKMLIFNAVLIFSIVIPAFYVLQLGYFILLPAILLLFASASSLEQATTCIAIIENFPPTARYTGVSLGYNFGNGILGGTVPFICEWLIRYTHFPLAPAFYIAFCALITGLVVYIWVPETKGNSLTSPK